MCNVNFSAIELAVRTGDKDENIDMIHFYIQLGFERAKSMQSLIDTKNSYLRIYNTLLETMCDSYLPTQWRMCTHNYIKQMMPILLEVCKKKEFQQIRSEVNAFGHYFLNVNESSKTNV